MQNCLIFNSFFGRELAILTWTQNLGRKQIQVLFLPVHLYNDYILVEPRDTFFFFFPISEIRTKHKIRIIYIPTHLLKKKKKYLIVINRTYHKRKKNSYTILFPFL